MEIATASQDVDQLNEAAFSAGLGPSGRADSLITNQGVPTTTTTAPVPTSTTIAGTTAQTDVPDC